MTMFDKEYNLMPDRGDRSETKYSNRRDYSIGMRMNDKGRANRQHEETEDWPAEERGETGLILREPL